MTGSVPPDEQIPPPVPVESIFTTAVEIPSKGSETQSRAESESLAHERKVFEAELGWLGKTFGGRKEKPGNISAIVIVICLLFIALSYATDVIVAVKYTSQNIHPAMPFERIFSGLTAIVTLILGYLFGSNESGGR